MTKKTLLNGPINAVRLEGTVFGIKKSLLLFLDLHIDIRSQTKCNDYESIDIEKYLYEIIKNNKTVDMFFESNNVVDNESIKYTEKYIHETLSLFGKLRHLNKSTMAKNVRLHYMDIRNNYPMHNILNELKYIEQLLKQALQNDNIAASSIDIIKKKTKQIITDVDQDISNFYTNKNDKTLHKDILKIKKKYKHQEILKNFKVYDNIIHKLHGKIITNLNTCKQILETDNSKSIYFNLNTDQVAGSLFYNYGELKNVTILKLANLINNYDLVYLDVLDLYLFITDMFFLRRFLDKDYITSGIVYTGAAHSVNYIQHLVTVYDFKVTHFSYSSITNLNDVNKIIKNASKIENIGEIQKLFWPNDYIQCSNISDFPDL